MSCVPGQLVEGGAWGSSGPGGLLPKPEGSVWKSQKPGRVDRPVLTLARSEQRPWIAR